MRSKCTNMNPVYWNRGILTCVIQQLLNEVVHCLAKKKTLINNCISTIINVIWKTCKSVCNVQVALNENLKFTMVFNSVAWWEGGAVTLSPVARDKAFQILKRSRYPNAGAAIIPRSEKSFVEL